MPYIFFLLCFFVLTLSGKSQPLQTFKGHRSSVTSVVFCPDGLSLVTGSTDHTVILWKTNGKKIYRYQGHSQEVRSVAVSPNGKWILTGSADQSVRLWDMAGNCVRVFHDSTLTQSGIAYQGLKNQVEQYLVNNHLLSKQDTAQRHQKDEQTTTPIPLLAHTDAVNSVSFSSDGTRILTSSKDRTAKI
jgi:WD40 repeat protein